MINPERVRSMADDLFDESVRVRRTIHRNPELSFKEEATARYISAELTAAGIAHKTNVGGNGIVATVGHDEPVIALRADIDALPIREATAHDFRSLVDGVMHACGHDSHTSMLLTAGRILSSLGDDLRGTVKLLFQHAEEVAPGGAQGMIAAGALDSPRVAHVIGQHVNTEIPVGSVGFNPGLFMASADEIYITVHGVGGHAAKPHQGVDPIAIASTLVVTLQQIVSRNADPIVPNVLTFGRMIGDGASNVIPDSVELAGTFRTLDSEWREVAVERIEKTARSIVEALGGRADVKIVRGYPAVVNDPEVAARARASAVAYLGADRVVDLPPAMWAEDFAYYGIARPSCFYNIGVRNEARGIIHAVHTPRFDIDEDALRVGSGLMAWIALGELAAA